MRLVRIRPTAPARPLVEGHAGHLAVACQDTDGEMGDMVVVAARLVAMVDYLFTHGAVLEDGQTLGATESEKFRISRPDTDVNLTLTLEAEAA